MKKRLSVLIMAILFTLTVLVGCGNDEKASTSDETVTTSVQYTAEIASDEQSSTFSSEASKADEESKTESKSENSESSAQPSTSATKSDSTSKNTSSSAASGKPSTAAVSSVGLSKSSMSVTVGSSDTFTVTIYPSNAADTSYTASTNNGNATVSCSGSTVTVNGVKAGSCTITVESSNNKTATCNVTVKAKSSSGNSSTASGSNAGSSKEAQAKAVAQKIADASYKIAHITSSSPTDLELVSIACQLVAEYCRVCTYTTDDPDYSTAYGVFVKKVYTCAGSARALGMVLDCMGYSWTHANENEWTHQWCELTMDGKKGWADAYDGYNASYAIGAGYGDYNPSAGGDVLEQFGVKWQGRTTYISGSYESGKIVYDLTSWKAYYGLGKEQLIEFYNNDNFVKMQETINGSVSYEYNVETGQANGYIFTADLV